MHSAKLDSDTKQAVRLHNGYFALQCNLQGCLVQKKGTSIAISVQYDRFYCSASTIFQTIFGGAEKGENIGHPPETLDKGNNESENSPTRRFQSVLVHTSRKFPRCQNRASFHNRLLVALLN